MEKRTTQQHLEQLPALFHWKELVTTLGFGSDASARVTVARWCSEEVVAALGSNSGLYRNNAKDLDVPLWAKVMERLSIRDALIVGEMALYLAGWIENKPEVVDLAIPPKKVLPTFPGTQLTTRPLTWLRHTAGEKFYYGVRIAKPLSIHADFTISAPNRLPDLQIQLPDNVSMAAIHREANLLSRVCKRYQVRNYF